RKEKRIRSAQEAAVEVTVSSGDFDFLTAHQNDLETICIVSRLRVRQSPATSESRDITVSVDQAPGAKCQRCWNYRESVGMSATHPGLCDRCLAVLQERQ
ncbi:MAG TPA: zinc finger domain-containing protein, partial [Candidatus Methylomirabilis sp.]|nr:zinc finger domain-containing protein [Candidatus Methylomirabilis sp.]